MKSIVKKFLTTILSFAMILSLLCTSTYALEYGSEWSDYDNTNKQKYSDIDKTHWAYEAINRASDKNWFGGYPDGSFRPDDSITRAEALKVFAVFLGLEIEEVTESTFYDVDTNEWYAPYIEVGKDLFPTHTTVQGKRAFNPDMPVTREDTIYALVNALGYQVGVKYVDESLLNMFTDKNSISGDLKAHFVIALENELVSGFPDGTIRAQDSLTRAEFATLLYRGSFVGHSDNYEAKISKVTVSPSSPVEIEIGESITLSARATYTDGKNQPYSSLQPYDAENNGVISLDETTITGLKEGTTTIKYNDSYLNKDSLTVIVKSPTDAPKIKITDYPGETDESRVTISGSVIDKNITTVDFSCNGKDIILNADGSFSTIVSLKPGENKISFVAVNEYKISGEKSISVIRTSAPSIFVSEYKTRTTSKTTPVSGIVSDSDIKTVKLTCNDTDVALNVDGSFTTEVTLGKLGKNEFAFTAVNQYDKSSNQTITITRYEIIEEPEEEKVEEIPDDEDKVSGKVQIAFVIDSTGSMYDEIGNVKTNIAAFSKYLASLGVDDLKMSVVEYRDITCDGNDSTKIHYADGSPWHSTPEQVIDTLGSIDAAGGGDVPETVLDAFGCVLNNKYMDWTGDAYKFVVLLTDADYKLDNSHGIANLRTVADKLAGSNVYTSVITSPELYDTYKDLYEKTGGKTANITSNFDEILSSFADEIIEVSVDK